MRKNLISYVAMNYDLINSMLASNYFLILSGADFAKFDFFSDKLQCARWVYMYLRRQCHKLFYWNSLRASCLRILRRILPDGDLGIWSILMIPPLSCLCLAKCAVKKANNIINFAKVITCFPCLGLSTSEDISSI